MPDDDIFYANFLQHIRGNFSGECAALLEVQVLRTQFDVAALERLCHCRQADIRRADDNLSLGICNQRKQILHQRHRLGRGFIHFPVSRDNWFSHNILQILFP